MAKMRNGLEMIRINNFWISVRMSWLRGLTFCDSTWANLHRQETKPFTFSPMTSTLSDLEEARNMTKILVWRDIYDSLILCRRNEVFPNPIIFLLLPVNGEPAITPNYTHVNQHWCKTLMIKDVLNNVCDWKKNK